MELAEYFFRHRKTTNQRRFAEKIGCAAHTLNQIIHYKQNPNFILALRIFFESKGEVSLLEMLKPEDFEELKKMYGIVKKESIYQDDKRPDCQVIDLSNGTKRE